MFRNNLKIFKDKTESCRNVLVNYVLGGEFSDKIDIFN